MAVIDPADLLLFSVDLQGLTVTEGLAAYGDPADPLLPLGELTRLLDLDVEVRPAEGRVIGRIGEARRALVVDLGAHLARIGAEDVPFTAEDVAVTASEIYARSSLVTKLLPLKIAIDESQLTLSLTATEKLPVQARLERLANRPQSDRINAAPEEVLIIPAPYRLFSPPGFDVVLDAGARATEPRLPFRYELRAASDLLYSNFQGYLASDERGRPASATVLLQRKSVEGGLLGPLHGRDLSLGDVFTPGLPMGARSVSGRGVTFSTVPIAQTSVFNRIDIRGDLAPEQDVELYVNDVLRGSTSQATNGRYEFLNVPLSPGLNVVRTVTYGPRGERKEETQVINVGAGLLQRGDVTFEFGLVDQQRPVFTLDQPAEEDEGRDTVTAHGLRVIGTLNYGLAEFLTLSLGGALTPQSNGDSLGIYTAGVRTSLFGLATQFDTAFDSRGGSGEALGLAGQWNGVSAVLRHAEYRGGFVDENNLGSNTALDLRRRTELSFDSALKLRGRILPVSLRGVRNVYSDGSYDVTAGARISSSVGGYLFSTGLEYGRTSYRPAQPSDTLSGYLTASTYASYKWQLRLGLDYELLPEPVARNISFSADRRISDNLALRLAVGQPLDDLNATDVLLAGIITTRYGDLSLTGEYDNGQRDWRFGAQWNFGLGYDPMLGRYDITRTGPGSGGSVIFDAYMDANANGVRDPGEAPVPDVVVQGGGQTQSITGANGGVFVSGVGTGPTARLNVNLEKVDITSVKSPPTTVQVSPRPGSIAHVNYPLSPTGDVMVKLELVREDGKHVGLSAVRVQLVPEKGSPVELTTEFDGSALFSGLAVGVYKLQLDPKQAQQLRMHLVDPPTIAIKGDGSFTPDAIVQVKFDPAPDAPAPQVAGGSGSGG
jgi:hypothetical protein